MISTVDAWKASEVDIMRKETRIEVGSLLLCQDQASEGTEQARSWQRSRLTTEIRGSFRGSRHRLREIEESWYWFYTQKQEELITIVQRFCNARKGLDLYDATSLRFLLQKITLNWWEWEQLSSFTVDRRQGLDRLWETIKQKYTSTNLKALSNMPRKIFSQSLRCHIS